MKRAIGVVILACAAPLLALLADTPPPGFALIPAGAFEMGDHHGFVDPQHGSDETPLHAVRLGAFYMGVNDVTTQEYCTFLNSALSQHQIEVRQGGVYLVGGRDLLAETRAMSPYSRIGWDGARFSVLDHREQHPVVCIRWPGAAVFANWLSAQNHLPAVYDTATWACDLSKSGFRLPTEAEWEYAARGGQKSPYRNYPWGDDPDATKANWPESKNPFRSGPLPWTTPAGFFNGALQKKADWGWPAAPDTFQTSNGANGYGLFDMSGNVWQFVNDWYERSYYGYGPAENPPGPARGSVMPDGQPYRGMRGGNWFNGEHGHGRVSNRNPSNYRGPDDPNHPYYHVGFRLVLPIGAESRPVVRPMPVQAGTRSGSFVLRSSEVADGGTLPVEFTGDGASATLPLEWSGAPAGTKSYALVMHHIDPEGLVKWYWVLYNIPGDVQRLPKNVKGIGTLGNNSINQQVGYAPPHSKGPGAKTYIYTVYALSAPPQITAAPAQVNREVLLAAIKDRTLGSAELRVVYTRQGTGEEEGAGPGPGGGAGRGGPGGRSEMADNKTPTSPNPGQTVGLFFTTPKASAGYTLMAPKHNTATYLLDNDGKIVHQWKSGYEPGQSAYLLPNGHLLRAGMLRVPGGTGGGEGGRIEEFDWDGRLVWAFEHASRDAQLHHDIKPMPNGHVLALMIERKSREQAAAAGFDTNALETDYLLPDAVVEIEPVPPNGGRIVWEWHVWDHLTHGADPAAHPELVAPAGQGRSIRAFWNHMNSLDYNAALDQIVLSVRGNSEIWIVDHSTTTAEAAGHAGGRAGRGGDLLYRWGNPSMYGRGAAADRQLIQQHDAQWIPEGSPGAGHLLIFNNGYERGWSSIEEIVPPMDSARRYVIPAGKAFGPEKPAWHYEAASRTDFFSSEISGSQRLPNGNTLVCAGVVGHLFEVTPAGEMVWQYVNPMVRGGILAQGELPGKDVRGHLFNAVFKVHRYAPDYPGLRGKDLTPKGVIELPASQKGKTGLDKADAPAGEGRGGRGRGGQGGER